MKKIIAPLILVAVFLVGVGTAFVLSPKSHNHNRITVRASSVVQVSDVVTAEYSVTFQTIDGEVLAVVQTVDARVPIELIPNAPTIYLRPFLRWTNVQGYSLGGIIQANITFLPLYSYDPQFKPEDPDVIGKPNEVKKSQWRFMNFILDDDAILFGGLIGFGVLVFLLFFFLVLLRGVFR